MANTGRESSKLAGQVKNGSQRASSILFEEVICLLWSTKAVISSKFFLLNVSDSLCL